MSTTLNSLLQACKDSPQDDAPRLILSDWLEENGDPERAEFIRLQLRQDSNDNWRPDSAEAVARAHRLLRKNARRWFGAPYKPLHPYEDFKFWKYPNAVDFDERGRVVEYPNAIGTVNRGLLTLEIEYMHKVPTVLAALPAYVMPWIDGLEYPGYEDDPEEAVEVPEDAAINIFSHVNLNTDSLNKASAMDWLDRNPLHSLSFMNEVYSNTLEEVSRLENVRLQNLHFFAFQDSDANWNQVLNSPALSELQEFSVVVFEDTKFMKTLSEAKFLKHLKSLYLQFDSYQVSGLKSLLTSREIQGLTGLTLCSVYEGGKNQSVVATALAKSHCRSLTQLSLERIAINETQAKQLAKSGILKNIKTLSLKRCPVSPEGMKHLLQSPDSDKLEKLILQNMNHADEIVSVLSECHHLEHLRILDLEASRLTADAVKVLGNSESLANLEQLNLSATGLTPGGIQALARATHMTNLKRLDIREVKFSTASMRSLARWSFLKNLVRLDLSDCRLDSKEVTELALADMPHLRELIITDNEFGPEGANALADADWLQHLLTIDVGGNDIEYKGLKALLKQLPTDQLVRLDVDWNDISKTGIQSLLKWPGLPRLCTFYAYQGENWWKLLKQLDEVIIESTEL